MKTLPKPICLSRNASTAGSRFLTTLLFCATTTAISMRADAATWNGGSLTGANWTDTGNWNGVAPVAMEALTFSGATRTINQNNFTADTTFGAITFATGAGAFALSGNRIQLGGDILNNSNQIQTFNLAVVFTANRTINTAAGDVAIAGVISGSRALTKSGLHTLTLSGSNSISGVTLNGGTLVVGNDSALGTGNISFLGGANGDSTGGILRGDGTARTIANTLQLGNNFTQDGGTIGGSSDLTITGAATHSGQGLMVLYITNTAKTTISGSVRLGSSNSVARGIDFRTAAGADLLLSGVLRNNGTQADYLVKSGLGTITLSGSNTYTGRTQVSDGRLILDLGQHSGDISSGSVLLSTNTVTLGDTLEIKGKNTGTSQQTVASVTLMDGKGSTLIVNPNAGAGTTFTTGTIGRGASSGSTVAFDISASGAEVATTTTVLTNSILGYATVKDAGGFGFATLDSGKIKRYTGASALAASGNNATTNYFYNPTGGSPDLVMAAGAKSINSLAINTNSNSGSLALTSGTLTITSRGLLMTGSNDFTIKAGGQLGSAGSELLVHQDGGGALTVESTVLSGAGVLSKTGEGKLVLKGTSAYTGSTWVQKGTLLVDGSLTGTGAVTVQHGATLGGSGSIKAASTVTIKEGGTLAPGSSAGILTLGSLALESGSYFSLELDGNTPGVGGYDQVVTSGTISLNGAHLVLDLNYEAAVNDTFTLINNTANGIISGSFASVNGTAFGENHTFNLTVGESLYGLQLFYADPLFPGTNNLMLQVMSVTTVPEPGSVALLLLPGIAWFWSRRRSNRI